MATKRRIITKRLSRGARKGQSVQGYITRSGKFQAIPAKTRGGQTVKLGAGKGKGAAFATDRNMQRGNPRAGKTFTRATTASGQQIHRYIGKGGKPQDVVVKGATKPAAIGKRKRTAAKKKKR